MHCVCVSDRSAAHIPVVQTAGFTRGRVARRNTARVVRTLAQAHEGEPGSGVPAHLLTHAHRIQCERGRRALSPHAHAHSVQSCPFQVHDSRFPRNRRQKTKALPVSTSRRTWAEKQLPVSNCSQRHVFTKINFSIHESSLGNNRLFMNPYDPWIRARNVMVSARAQVSAGRHVTDREYSEIVTPLRTSVYLVMKDATTHDQTHTRPQQT